MRTARELWARETRRERQQPRQIHFFARQDSFLLTEILQQHWRANPGLETVSYRWLTTAASVADPAARIARLSACEKRLLHGMPSKPNASNRLDHFETLVMLMPSSAATSFSFLPFARSRIMRARRLSRWGVVVARKRRCSSIRSSRVTSSWENRSGHGPRINQAEIIATYFSDSTLAFSRARVTV